MSKHLAAAALMAATSAAAAASSAAPGAEEGRVTYLTATRAYLDRGRAEGLEAGAQLRLERNGKRAATCQVDSVADHAATCAGSGIQVGDSFQAPRSRTDGAGARRQPVPSPAELSRSRAAVQAASFPRVAFHRRPVAVAERRGFSAEARVGDLGWFSAAGFHQERADVALRRVPLLFGARLDVDATALAWTRRPARFLSPSTRATQLWVRQAAISYREGKLPVTFAVGRLWPWGAPGLDAMDGAQLGYRAPDGGWEVGGFGGGRPDPLTTAPTLQRTAFGGYVTGRLDAPRWAALTHEARISLMSAPEYGTRVEGEGRLRATLWRALDVGAEVRVGVGGAQAPWAVDMARLDADLRLGGSLLRLGGAVRYVGNEAIDLPTIGALAPGTRSLHADASATYRPLPWLSFGLLGNLARDLETRFDRGLVAAEVELPAAFGEAGGFALGWMEERGWIGGRSPYAQLTLRPLQSLQLFGRIAWSHEVYARIADAPPGDDLALFLSVEYQPWRWMTVRCTAAGRTSLGRALAGDGGLEGLGAGPAGLTLHSSLGVNL